MNKRTLYTPKQKGGLAVPDLLKFFYVAQLAQLIRFHSHLHHPLWMQVESYSCRFRRISYAMWLSVQDRTLILCPSLSLSFRIWDRLSKSHNLKSPHCPLAPLQGNRDFTPGLTPPTHFNGGPIKVSYA